MTMAAVLRHEVSAYNLSAASENKIHDDSVAKKFGFEGGLAPGVEVYAYMTHLPVTRFGPYSPHGDLPSASGSPGVLMGRPTGAA